MLINILQFRARLLNYPFSTIRSSQFENIIANKNSGKDLRLFDKDDKSLTIGLAANDEY